MKKSRLFTLMITGVVLMLVLLACQPEATTDESPAAVATEAPTLAPTVVEPTPTAEPDPTNTPEPVIEPTEASEEVTEAVEPPPTEAPTEEPTPVPTPTEEPGIVRTYEIVQDRSEARFFVDEVLFGNPKTVVGRTSQVTGQILLNLKAPNEAEVSSIQVNARDLATDDSFRNRALRSQILDSSQDAYQFITFTLTGIDGLNEQPAVIGEPLTFNLTGDLQIRDITNSVTFVITATAASETELNGMGVVTVLRSDYDLRIPSVPGVANVSDEVRLEFDFTAIANEE